MRICRTLLIATYVLRYFPILEKKYAGKVVAEFRGVNILAWRCVSYFYPLTFLMALAFLKFVMVAAFFMHLKFDSPMLRRLFITGIVLAAVVYTVALLTLRVLV